MKNYFLITTLGTLILTAILVQGCGPVAATTNPGTVACEPGNDGDGQLERTCTDIQVVNRNSLVILPALTFKLTQVATLAPPVISGTTLQASDIILGTKNQAVVAFNVAGNTQAGALDLLDVSNPAHPTLTNQVLTPSIDINGLAREGDRIYAVGALNNVGAVLNTVDIVSNQLSNSSLTTYNLPSYAGTSVAANNGTIAVASGDTGGFQIFASTNLATATTTNTVADARALRYDSTGKLLVLSGQPGTARIYATSAATTPSATHALGGNSIAQSKSTIEVHSTVYVASLGDAGAKIICTADGGTLATIAPISVSGLASTKTVTNAATLTNGLLFTANGEAGVTVYNVQNNGHTVGACAGITVTELGALSLGAGFSANNVYYSNSYLFVASGTGGLSIIYVYNAFGLLDYVFDTVLKTGIDAY